MKIKLAMGDLIYILLISALTVMILVSEFEALAVISQS
jgi:hypothetical protein